MGISKMPLEAHGLGNQPLIEGLKQLAPEVIKDGKIDFELLRELLGDHALDDEEKAEPWGLNWTGKSQARKLAMARTKGTLRPLVGEGVNEASSQNLFIQGDNLEVLKTLQKSYLGKIKMIYIDPPYNTGNDFVYEDDFRDNLSSYIDKAGKNLHSNKKDSGRFHANWLNFMYPRLKIAKSLLKDDGVIFVSIDDNEVHNLRSLMNEVFGEENFVAALVYDKNRKNDAKYFSVGHEYMLVFFKSIQHMKDLGLVLRANKEGVDDVKSEFERLRKVHQDNWELVQEDLRSFYKSWNKDDERYPLRRFNKVDEKGPFRDDGNISWPGGGGPKYQVLHPKTKKPCKVPDGGWRFPKPERMQEEITNGRVVFGDDETTLPRIRRNLFEANKEVMRSVTFSYAQTATVEFNKIFNNKRVFDNPKYHVDILKLVNYVTDNNTNDIILDFFAGSATTAQAVMELNKEDGGNRKFILVQLEEETPPKSEARKAGYEHIAQISKDRIRKVIEKIKAEQNSLEAEVMQLEDDLQMLKNEKDQLVAEQNIDLTLFDNDAHATKPKALQKLEDKLAQQSTAIEDCRQKIAHIAQTDLGFKAFQLAQSNFKEWQAPQGTPNAQQVGIAFGEAADTRLEAGFSKENIIAEILLQKGFTLDLPTMHAAQFDKNTVWQVTDPASGKGVLVCLDEQMHPDTAQQLRQVVGHTFICRGEAISDQIKLQFSDAGLIETI